MDPTLKSGSTNTLGFNAQKTVGGMRAGPTATRYNIKFIYKYTSLNNKNTF